MLSLQSFRVYQFVNIFDFDRTKYKSNIIYTMVSICNVIIASSKLPTLYVEKHWSRCLSLYLYKSLTVNILNYLKSKSSTYFISQTILGLIIINYVIVNFVNKQSVLHQLQFKLKCVLLYIF